MENLGLPSSQEISEEYVMSRFSSKQKLGIF